MEIIDCNNHVKSTINFFGPSCAVKSLADKYNPLGKVKMPEKNKHTFLSHNCNL